MTAQDGEPAATVQAKSAPATGSLSPVAHEPTPAASPQHTPLTHPPAKSTPRADTPAPAPAKSKLSVSQMLHLMRVEFLRARSQRYPITCLMISVKGIDELQPAHGWEAKQKLMRGAYDLLRKTTGTHAFFGMVLMSGDRLMAVFPNTTPTRTGELGRLLVEGSHGLGVEIGAEKLPLRLSIGASHNLLLETSTFERYVEMAGRALAMAHEAGGDRYIMWREAEAEIEELRGELKERSKSFQEQHEVLMEEHASVGGLQQASIIDQIQRVFASTARTPEIARIEEEIVRLATKELFEERQKAVQAQVVEHQRNIDLLERRIVKLTEMLGVTEGELGRVIAMKGIDPGVASIYRTVQGLSMDDGQAEAKRAMMSDIFKANLAFQKRPETQAA